MSVVALAIWLGTLFLSRPLTLQTYTFQRDPIDVVIPCAEKDRGSLDACIKGIRENGDLIGRIFVVSRERWSDQAEWLDEKRYPFTKEAIFECLFDSSKKGEKRRHRIGWIYQQLLKLYAYRVIPDSSSNILVLDADTVFLNPVQFLDAEGGGLYNRGLEVPHLPYFAHARRLLGSLGRKVPFSAVCHHMLFQRAVLEHLFQRVEAEHGKEFWRAFVEAIDRKEAGDSSASEYELYFHFASQTTSQVKIRTLLWAEVPSIAEAREYQRRGYHYVTAHVR
jgi:hypothetical protein